MLVITILAKKYIHFDIGKRVRVNGSEHVIVQYSETVFRYHSRYAEYKVTLAEQGDYRLNALDELMEYLLSLDAQERKQVAEMLKAHIKEVIEDQKPIN